jgi:hypothetical protein
MSFIIHLTENSALFVGSSSNSSSKTFMQENNIKMVINCTDDHPNYFEDELKYLKVPVEDHPNA